MNKLLIPTILTATILIAGMFAFMPVEKANAVHTSILANTVTIKTVRCAETVNMAAANDDGTFTLNLAAGATNMIVVDAQLESGAQPFDADDTLVIADIAIDAVTLGTGAAASLADVTFDDAPTEGDFANLMLTQPLAANDNVVVTVAGTATTNTSDYTISFFYLAPQQDADATCDVVLA